MPGVILRRSFAVNSRGRRQQRRRLRAAPLLPKGETTFGLEEAAQRIDDTASKEPVQEGGKGAHPPKCARPQAGGRDAVLLGFQMRKHLLETAILEKKHADRLLLVPATYLRESNDVRFQGLLKGRKRRARSSRGMSEPPTRLTLDKVELVRSSCARFATHLCEKPPLLNT